MANVDALDTILKLGIGYFIGKQGNADWKPIIDNFKKRLELLQYPKIPIPWGFFDLNKNMKTIYREGLFCYLHGLPNSCIPSMVRVLEKSLEKKYEIIETGKSAKNIRLESLIDWADKLLNNKTDTAHAFRLLRNYIHTSEVIQEADALEAIRHISIIVNDIHQVNGSISPLVTCLHCHSQFLQALDPKMTYLAQNHILNCPKCRGSFNWVLFP